MAFPRGRAFGVAIVLALLTASPAVASGPNLTAGHQAAAESTSPDQTAPESDGRLRVPELSIARRIFVWGCRGGEIPDRVWSWTCSGQNNLYLLGHAWGAFKPLHDGYRDGLLHHGMKLRLVDASGNADRYRLAWYRLVSQDELGTNMWGPGSTWAWNATKHRVVTLQTCYGPDSSLRLIVRFKLER
jgi:hypothetical protein